MNSCTVSRHGSTAMKSGIRLWSRFRNRLSNLSEVSDASERGTSPMSTLLERSNAVSDVRLPSSGGMDSES